MRPPRVTSAEVLDGLWLRLSFSDGALIEVDVGPLLDGPVFDDIRADRAMFQGVAVDQELGTVVWPGHVDLAAAA